MRVLIVEDRLGKCQRLVRILEKYQITDYWIETTKEGALKKINETTFDLLIMDLKFPEFYHQKEIQKTGFGMMLELAFRNIQIPTIVYSAMPLSKAEIRALEEANYSFIHLTDSFQIESFFVEKLVTQKSG